MEKKSSRKVFKDLIREAIYEAIVSGELQPGERIIEMEWAQRFDSSQAPVREAIRELDSLGVVEYLPFKGASVRKLNKKELCDIRSVRAGLETIALRNAIRNADDASVAELRQILDDMEMAAELKNRNLFVEKNTEFHKAIVLMADTTELFKMWQMCNIEIWTAFTTDHTETAMVELAKRHEDIYETLKNRDEKKVFDVIIEHFEGIQEELADEA
ncbi:MAG: GntR family transcriptional regulator [Eubacterium sp.]|nr:GntR family transcriptional regulator [Eubacterium sp.]